MQAYQNIIELLATNGALRGFKVSRTKRGWCAVLVYPRPPRELQGKNLVVTGQGSHEDACRLVLKLHDAVIKHPKFKLIYPLGLISYNGLRGSLSPFDPSARKKADRTASTLYPWMFGLEPVPAWVVSEEDRVF